MSLVERAPLLEVAVVVLLRIGVLVVRVLVLHFIQPHEVLEVHLENGSLVLRGLYLKQQFEFVLNLHVATVQVAVQFEAIL